MITLERRSIRFRELLSQLQQNYSESYLSLIGRKISALEAKETTPIFNDTLLDIALSSIQLITTRQGVPFQSVIDRMFEIQDKKGRDYGEDVDGLRNLRRRGQYGVIARMGDKLSRLESLCKPGREAAVTDESVE